MAGGNEGHGDFFADQVLRAVDPRTVTRHQGFGAADLGGDEEGLHRDFTGYRGGERAGTEVADLHVAGRDGGDDVGAIVEFAPVDLGVGGFFIGAVGLGDFGRVHGGLIRNGHVRRLGKQAGTGQGQCGQQAQRGQQFQGEAPQSGGRGSA